jgi:acyl dehydratase
LSGVESLEGHSFPSRRLRVCVEKVAEFVAVTGDDPDRWQSAAPPGFAAALLFTVAPDLLADRRVEGAVVHGDQAFTWHGPLQVETDLEVLGTVERVRSRGGVAFVSFGLEAHVDDSLIVEGRSTFLVGGDGPGLSEVDPIPPDWRGPTASVGTELPSPRSASRADLVRYAAATRDWNPIHWDHSVAVEAGLGGVVVHGLLQSAWLTQVAATAGSGDDPLASARFRYTAPLRPGQAARIEGDLTPPNSELRLAVDETVTVTGRFEVRS